MSHENSPEVNLPTNTPAGCTPMPQVENPDLEAVRRLAYELVHDNMHFHEVAIADPFKAERYVQDAGSRLLKLVGWPTGMQVYEVVPPEELAVTYTSNNPESPCAICRSYGHFTHNHPEGYVNPMYDLLGPDDDLTVLGHCPHGVDLDREFCPKGCRV